MNLELIISLLLIVLVTFYFFKITAFIIKAIIHMFEWNSLINSINKIPKKQSINPPPVDVPIKVNKLNIKLEKELNDWKISKTNELLNFDSLFQLTKNKNIIDIGYKDLLQTMEWQIKRLEILARDGYVCQKCNERSERNHVHHKWYIKDEFPWEIESNALVTLCHFCHKEVHLSEEIPVYGRNLNGSLIQTFNSNIYCGRCNGAGWFPQFKHVQDGICFACWGDCISKTIFSNAIKKFNNRKTLSYEDEILLQLDKLMASFDSKFYKDKIEPMRNFGDLPL